jgi:hypothetical protein
VVVSIYRISYHDKKMDKMMDGTLLLILDNHVLLYNTKCFKDFMKKSGIA